MVGLVDREDQFWTWFILKCLLDIQTKDELGDNWEYGSGVQGRGEWIYLTIKQESEEKS